MWMSPDMTAILFSKQTTSNLEHSFQKEQKEQPRFVIDQEVWPRSQHQNQSQRWLSRNMLHSTNHKDCGRHCFGWGWFRRLLLSRVAWKLHNQKFLMRTKVVLIGSCSCLRSVACFFFFLQDGIGFRRQVVDKRSCITFKGRREKFFKNGKGGKTMNCINRCRRKK